MYISKGVIVVSASDVVAFLHCPHVATLDLEVARGDRAKPPTSDPMLDLLRGRGLQHEARYLEALEAKSLKVTNVDGNDGPGEGVGTSVEERAIATIGALTAGSEVVFQATFLDEHSGLKWRGHADFLVRIPQSTNFGSWGYEPQDTKLSTHPSASAVLQLCFYADMISKLQGSPVAELHIVLGSNEQATFRVDEFGAYFRNVRARFAEALATGADTAPIPNEHCRVCRWAATCNATWEEQDHLTRVAGLSVDNAKQLTNSGISTLTALAKSDGDLVIPRMSDAVLRRLQQQARLQLSARPGKPPPWELVTPFETEKGLAALPAPDDGDIFYDIEGHPYAAPGGLEYLHGFEYLDGRGYTFSGWWAHSEPEEQQVFENLIDFFTERRQKYPNMHVYHYAPYEITALRRLMMKYGTREVELDDLLRGSVFVDLYRVVRQGLRIGVRSYSIKKLEPLYMPPRDDAIGDGGSSIVAYEEWLQHGNQRILDEILAYNKDDVVSNRLLRDWLEARRHDALSKGLPDERPSFVAPSGDTLPDDLRDLINRLNQNRLAEAR